MPHGVENWLIVFHANAFKSATYAGLLEFIFPEPNYHRIGDDAGSQRR